MPYTISMAECLAWKYKYFRIQCTKQCNKHTEITHISRTHRKTVRTFYLDQQQPLMKILCMCSLRRIHVLCVSAKSKWNQKSTEKRIQKPNGKNKCTNFGTYTHTIIYLFHFYQRKRRKSQSRSECCNEKKNGSHSSKELKNEIRDATLDYAIVST